MTKVILTFHGRSAHQPDGRFTMMDDIEGSSTQTFIVSPGQELKFHNPGQFNELTLTVDAVVND